MNELRIGVRDLAHDELERANREHTFFSSSHEAFGVILEELEETVEAMENFHKKNLKFWEQTKKDASRNEKRVTLVDARTEAVEMACEAIQLIAMCEKAIISMYAEPVQAEQKKEKSWLEKLVDAVGWK